MSPLGEPWSSQTRSGGPLVWPLWGLMRPPLRWPGRICRLAQRPFRRSGTNTRMPSNDMGASDHSSCESHSTPKGGAHHRWWRCPAIWIQTSKITTRIILFGGHLPHRGRGWSWSNHPNGGLSLSIRGRHQSLLEQPGGWWGGIGTAEFQAPQAKMRCLWVWEQCSICTSLPLQWQGKSYSCGEAIQQSQGLIISPEHLDQTHPKAQHPCHTVLWSGDHTTHQFVIGVCVWIPPHEVD